MGSLVYSVLCSLDLYVADTAGEFGWAEPGPEVHQFVNDRTRRTSTQLVGRRTYAYMDYWEGPGDADEPEVARDFRSVWQAADKVVYSTTLDAVSAPRTRLERAFDPAAVRRLVAEAPGEVAIGGPGLASAALEAGLVDVVETYLAPVAVGGGTRALPDGMRLDLTLTESHVFDSGFAWLRYDVRH